MILERIKDKLYQTKKPVYHFANCIGLPMTEFDDFSIVKQHIKLLDKNYNELLSMLYHENN